MEQMFEHARELFANDQVYVTRASDRITLHCNSPKDADVVNEYLEQRLCGTDEENLP